MKWLLKNLLICLLCCGLSSCADTDGLMTRKDLKQIKLKDGVYDGSYEKRPYMRAKVLVTIKDGKLADVKLLPGYGLAPSKFKYRYKIEEMLDNMVEQQRVQVDYVSGATQSSYSVMQAVQDAVNKAVIKTN